jgi:hypothetical protein
LSKTRRVLWLCFGLGAVAHLSLAQVRALKAEEKVSKPLTTQFVKRQPRLTKPLELKKLPRPKRRQIQRQMVAVKARIERAKVEARFQARQTLGGLARPGVAVGRLASFPDAAFAPVATAAVIEGEREPEYKIDTDLELLDIEALDTGKYHAMVIQDPNEKRAIKGFCHLAMLFSREMYPVTSEYSFDNYILPGFLKVPPAMNHFTDIKTDVLGRLSPTDHRLSRAPWVFFGAHNHVPMPSAAGLANLGRYMMAGGFIFADCHNYWIQGPTACYTSLHNILLEALATQDVDISFEPVPNNHQVYHCYFDFDGPPVGGESVDKGHYPDLVRINRYLEGLEVDGRLMALLSGKLIYGGWYFGERGWSATWDPKRPLQFAVNMIVFSLTQEGSITHRLMETIR